MTDTLDASEHLLNKCYSGPLASHELCKVTSGPPIVSCLDTTQRKAALPEQSRANADDILKGCFTPLYFSDEKMIDGA